MNRKPGMKICVCQIVVCNFNLAIKLPCSWKEIRKITRYGPKRPAAYIGWGDFWFGPFWRPRRLLWPQKQPQRTDLTSDLKSVTPNTYMSVCILLVCFGPILRAFRRPQRPLQPPNGLGAKISSDLEFVAQIAHATMFVWAV